MDLAPGYLMTPLGWTAKLLGPMLMAEPSLYPAMFTLSWRRMHLIGLALAHWPHESPVPGRLLIHGRPAAVLDVVLPSRPVGVVPALARLPLQVLSPDHYRGLVRLLADRITAKLIYHRKRLCGDYIALLDEIPPALRRLITTDIEPFPVRPKGFIASLRFLARRAGAASFESLVAELGSIDHADHVVARIVTIAEGLPLPDTLPPLNVGQAYRLDGVVGIRKLAKLWNNCLASVYLDAVNEGRVAIYLWPHDSSPAACLVRRHGRLGWALDEIQGPDNVRPPDARLDEIRATFAAAGIPEAAVLEPIEQLMRRHRNRRRPRTRAAELEFQHNQAGVGR